MKLIIIYLLTFVVIFYCHCISLAQQPKTSGEPSRTIDSLLLLTKSDKEDTTKVNILNNLCWEYCSIGEYDLGLKYGNTSLQIAQELNFLNGISMAYNNIGSIYYLQGNYDKALEFYFKLLKIREESGDKNGMAGSYGNIGLIHADKGDYDKALEFYFKALKIFEEIADKNGMAGSYGNIGIIHADKGDYDKALEFYFKSLKIDEEFGDKNGMAASYNNIGIIHADKGDYDKALEFYFKALKINEETGNKNWLANNYNNIGNIHSDKGDYDKALEFYFKSLKISEELGDKNGMAYSYNYIGNLYLKQNKVEEAKKYNLLALSIDKEIGAKDGMMTDYLSLSTCDSALGNFKNAYEYHQLYSEIKDSIFNEESSKQIHEMSAKYETEKKEKEIQLLNKDKEIATAENKKQKIISYSVSGGLLLVLILAVFIFRTNKKLSVKNSIIEKQNLEIAHKNKDLTDSILYAERIQRAILTSEQYLNDMFLPQGQTASHFILYKPKDIVAGDFYWAYSPSPTPLSFGEGSGVRPGGGALYLAHCRLHRTWCPRCFYEHDRKLIAQ